LIRSSLRSSAAAAIRQLDDTVAGRTVAGHWFITEEVQAMVTSTAPFTSGVHIARHDTANAAGRTRANFNRHDQFCAGTCTMAGCRKTPSNSSRKSNSGQLPSTTLTNGRERPRTYCLDRKSLRWSRCNSPFWPLADLREMSACAPLLANMRTSRIYEYTPFCNGPDDVKPPE